MRQVDSQFPQSWGLSHPNMRDLMRKRFNKALFLGFLIVVLMTIAKAVIFIKILIPPHMCDRFGLIIKDLISEGPGNAKPVTT